MIQSSAANAADTVPPGSGAKEMKMNQFTVALAHESHPAVRRVLAMNAWKIETWGEYAAWKRHARMWVALEGHQARILRDNPRLDFVDEVTG